MKITVIGLGHVGVVAAAGLALSGHDVLAVDIDRGVVDGLRQGKAPFYEPGLGGRIASALRRGTLRVMQRYEVNEDLGGVALVTAGTPPADGAASDLGQVREAVSWTRAMRPRDLVIAMKSTVPPGTGLSILEEELAGTGIGYAANPEFLREGQAITDWDFPDRTVIGVNSGDSRSAGAVKRMHAVIDAPLMLTDITSAEMIKYASNAFLAMRVSFINEMAALCDAVGASIDDVSQGLAMDSRTGARIHAGVGYGGSCFHRDLRSLDRLATAGRLDMELLRAVAGVNSRQRLLPLYALRRRFGGALDGLRVAVLGLSFKPGTDDVRDAPALDLVRAMAAGGADVTAFDPRATDIARPVLPTAVRLADSVEEVAETAEALVLMTEWEEIVNADWEEVARRMAHPRFVFDGRNALDPKAMTSLGFEYLGVGRKAVNRGKLGLGSQYGL